MTSLSFIVRRFLPCSLIAIFMLAMWSSCKPSTPQGVMSEGRLEDVLYDYMLALSMAENVPTEQGEDREALRFQYTQKVFQKYNISEEYFDSTMVWYASEGKRLKSIFERLNERLDAEAKSMGVGMSETELYASYTSDGDTANVWNGDRIVWLSRFQPGNVKTITLPADSTFLPGDIFKLSFDPHFLSPTGLHSVYVLFCAYYEDITVASQVRMVSGGNYRTEIDILPNLYQNTLQPQRLVITLYTPPLTAGSRDDLFYLTHPVLLRIHTRKPDEKPAETDAEALPVDSISSDSLTTDTLSLPIEPVRRLTPQEERDQREERHDIEIVKERIVRPARPARVRRSL